jgi:protein-tyrosine kinase
MSIIEKAVNALGRGKAGKNLKTGQAAADGSGPGQEAVDTVQRAEGSDPEHQHQHDDEYSPPTPTFEGETIVPVVNEELESVGEDRVIIPFNELRQMGILTPATPRSAIAEEYRTIKRPLLINISGDSVTPAIPHGNLIMVTSALEGDGKTFSAICLALSIAMERDKHVLFVDGDTAKAEAGRLLGVASTSPGLIDLLENKSAEAADFILPTNVEKLRILPAGGIHTHANELLASERMQQFVLELSEQDPNQVIVFDSPPLLMTTEAAVLASFMGQIVIVVSADRTPQNAVLQAIEHIGEDKMVGMVLNRARRGINPYFYSYGSGEGPYGAGYRGNQYYSDSGS